MRCSGDLTPDGSSAVLDALHLLRGLLSPLKRAELCERHPAIAGHTEEVGRISGIGGAFGYWGGVVSLFIMLLLLAENDAGVTLMGLRRCSGWTQTCAKAPARLGRSSQSGLPSS